MANIQQALKETPAFLLRPVFLIAGFLAYAVLRLVEPFRRVRVGLLMHGRIGHLSTNTETFLRSMALGKQDRDCSYLFFSGRPANSQLLAMIRRKLAVLRFPLAGVFFNQGLKPFVQGTRFEADLSRGFQPHEYEEFNRVPPQLSFSPGEIERGRRLLGRMGVPEGAPFVCFHARDKVYLDRLHAYNSREQWAYHDFRDCDIERYLPAAEYLAGQGLYMIRMGYLVEKPVRSANPRVIDYASTRRDDFADIYLAANCKFFLGSTAGLFCVAQCFDIPIASANHVPLGTVPLRAEDIFIPKKYWSVRENRFLSFREIIARGADLWFQSKQFEDAGVEARENTAEEILTLAQEMNARLDGTWKGEKEDEALQAEYHALFAPGHAIAGFPSRVGAGFLRANRELLR